MKTLIVLLAFACVFRIGDATISAWSEPSITGADGSAAAATTIAEDLAENTATGVTIQATGDGTVTYAIDSQPTSGKLTIDTNSGELTLAAAHSFDFETEPTYVLVIHGTDDGDNSIGTATVTLSITNVDDEDPVFVESQYVATVPDGSTEGTSVTTVSATDDGTDIGGSITYSITSGNDADHFEIDSSTGAISVKAGQTLDATTLGGYSLEVTATDATSATGTSTVWIAVKDCSSGGGALFASLLTVFVAMTVLLV